MSLGAVNLNDVIYPIQALGFARGEIEIVIHVEPGQPLDIGDGSYMVFGPDGELVVRARITEEWGEKALDAQWVMTLSFAFTDKLSNKARKLLGA